MTLFTRHKKIIWKRLTLFIVLLLLTVVMIFHHQRTLTSTPADDNNDIEEKDNVKIVMPTFLADLPLASLKFVKIASNDPQSRNSSSAEKGRPTESKRFSEGCKLSDLAVDDPEVKHFFKPMKSPDCASKEANWVRVENNTLVMNEDSRTKHGGQIDCTYVGMERSVDDSKLSQSRVVKNVPNGYRVLDDQFSVECLAKDGQKFKTWFAVVRAKDKTMESDNKVENGQGKKPSKTPHLNVYILGFDSLSRLTFMRKLKNTYKYLMQNLNAIILEGYNIVGDGTPQALIPMFTGKTELELPMTRKANKDAQYVDVYPWVWNEFKEKGYTTMYGEDSAGVGTFTYRLKGFKKQPTDYYMRPFYMMVEKENSGYSPQCYGNEPHHRVHFEYGHDFLVNTPATTPKFAFLFHSVYSHDDLNKVEWADDYMVEHLKFFQDKFRNNSMLILMSDHGHRFAALRQTQQGKLEERLPMFSIVLPTWFAKAFPVEMKNLHQNAKRLTTPFDIHATLRHILNLNSDSQSKPVTPDQHSALPRSLSLFGHIPNSRTCAQAFIEPHWCACLTWSRLPVDHALVALVAENVIRIINAETQPERRLCSPIKLTKIVSAFYNAPNEQVLKFKKSQDVNGFEPDLSGVGTPTIVHIQLTFNTNPGDALYEASLRLDLSKLEFGINLDSVSHINAYGDLPHCVIDKNYFLAKWCVCYDKIK